MSSFFGGGHWVALGRHCKLFGAIFLTVRSGQTPIYRTFCYFRFICPVKQHLSGETSALFGACEGLLLSGVWHSVQEKAFWCTRRVFKGTRCKKQASGVRNGNSVQKKAPWCTRRVFVMWPPKIGRFIVLDLLEWVFFVELQRKDIWIFVIRATSLRRPSITTFVNYAEKSCVKPSSFMPALHYFLAAFLAENRYIWHL